MLTTAILIGSVLLAAAFALAWIISPAIRRRIERPKHLFAEQVRQYDEHNDEPVGPAEGQSSEPH